ncbi:MFS transporter [Vallitalea okinawensis]|uniref:MFS transporter n=1 Tax=Vallitalea okinawensis TaxID=2078660 RepID=UPI001300A6F0|nr:MFS transporter [Vallitalea okinawensis]
MHKLRRKQIILFYMMTIFFWFSLYAYTSELTPYAESLGATHRMAGMITGAFGITQILLRLPQGIITDRINKRKIFINFGLLVGVLSALIPFFYPNVYTLLIGRLLAGITGSTWVAYTVLFTSYYDAHESPKAMGILNGFNYLGRMSAMLLGGIIAFSFGTPYLFILSSVGALIGLIFSFFIKDNDELSPDPINVKEIREISKDKLLIFYSLLAVISQFISFATVYGFTPIIATTNFAANSLQLGILAFLAILPAALISPFSGTLLIKWFGERNTLIIGFFISAITCFIIPLVPNLGMLYLVQFIAGAGKGMVFPLLMGLSIKHFPDDKRATAMGLYQAAYSAGIVFGPMVLGFVSDSYGLFTGFVVTGIIGFIAVIMVLLSHKQLGVKKTT